MKKSFFLIAVGIVLFFQTINAQTIEMVESIEIPAAVASYSALYVSAPQGVIVEGQSNAKAEITYGSGFDEIKKNVFEEAVRIFLDHLYLVSRVHFDFEPIRINVSISSIGNYVAMTSFKEFEGLNLSLARYGIYEYPYYGYYEQNAFPSAILKAITPTFKHSYNADLGASNDITIRISNKDIFYYGAKGDIAGTNKYDFITVMLRELLKGSGLCSNLVQRSDGFRVGNEYGKFLRYDQQIGTDYQITSPTTFENWLYNSDKILSAGHHVYCSNPFNSSISLNYLDVSYNHPTLGLLCPELPRETVIRGISTEITGIVQSLYGLDFTTDLSPTYPLDMATGITNNTISHNNNYTITTSRYGNTTEGIWKIQLLKKDGTYQDVQTVSLASTLSIPAYSLQNITTNDVVYTHGMATARILFTNYWNQNETTEKVFYIPAKPAKPFFNIVSAEENGYPDEMNVTLGFVCDGASSIRIRHKNDDYGYIDNYYLNAGTYYETFNDLDMTTVNEFHIYATNSLGTTISDPIYIGGAYTLSASTVNLSAAVQNNNSLKLLLKNDDGMNVENININKLTIQSVSNSSISSVYKKDYLNAETIDVSNLPKGVYGIRAIDANGKVYNTKFLK